ncbi:MAG TPA: heparinase II/III family protein, partial [Clostridia bacterium]|nr:heparinase II/III family protein [Clostridia bacterium]
EDAAVRAKGFHKALRSLDRYIETYMPDGCCDEGPMYWGAAGAGLFQCLELLYEASGGQINFYGLEKIRSIGQYIAKVHIDGEWFVNFADGDAHVFLDSATYRFGKALGDEGMMALGARAKPIRPAVYEWFHTYQHLQDLFMAQEREACALELPYLGEAWLWHTGVMTARERAGSPKGLFLAAKAGHNLESHNHNDVGSFIVYADGSPALIDIGTEEYSVKTFSAQRFDIWYTQSQYHNCPGVRGVLQQEGRAHCATEVEHRSGEWGSALSMELRDAYPGEAGIASWRREVALKRDPGMVAVTDRFTLHAPTDAVCRYLMTPQKPSLAPGLIVLPCEGGAVTVAYDADACAAEVEEIPIAESRLHWNWGDRLYRIILRERAPVLSAERTLVIRQA